MGNRNNRQANFSQANELIFVQQSCETLLEEAYEYKFRMIIIGDMAVGKTALLHYFLRGIFNVVASETIGAHFYTRRIEPRPGVQLKLELWDTSGQEQYRSIGRSFYRNAVGAILVYDITRRASFKRISNWLDDARKHTLQCVFMIVGHKSDLDDEREVSTEEGEHLAKELNMPFIETSAKSGQNIEEAFVTISREIFDGLLEGKIWMEEGWDGVRFGNLMIIPDLPDVNGNIRLEMEMEEGSGQRGGCC